MFDLSGVLTPPALPNTEFTHRFAVMSEPVENFFKDEGGKSNMLRVVVRLEELPLTARSHRKRTLPPLSRLPLKVTLHYESGNRVEDEAEIFHLISVDPPVFTPMAQDVEIKFRIEKVSRRKDGQRFKIRVEVDPEVEAAASVEGAFCRPITVLSKRKFPPSSHHGSASKRPSRRRVKSARSRNAHSFDGELVCAGTASGVLLRRVQDAEDAIEELLTKVQTQTARIAHLEAQCHHHFVSNAQQQQLDPVTGAVRRINSSSKLDGRYYSPCPLTMSPALDDGTDSLEMPVCETAEVVVIHASNLTGPTVAMGTSSPANDHGIGIPVLASPHGALKAPAFRRLRSSDLTFNFGPPSPLSFKDLD